jgi:hypothetical protein
MITNDLRKKHCSKVMDGDLKVFCVSNWEYNQYIELRKDEPFSASRHEELSGIKALRLYCQLIPAEAQFKAAGAFLEHQVPGLVGSIRQWLLQDSDGVTAEALAGSLNRARAECNGVSLHPSKLNGVRLPDGTSGLLFLLR